MEETIRIRDKDQEGMNMDNRKRRDLGMAYISDDAVMEEQKRCRRLMQKLNSVDRSDYEEIKKIIKEMLGKSEDAFINPPFYCDYGFNIEAGKNFFANYNCTIIDVAKVKIGDNSRLEKARRDRSHAKSFSYARPVLRLRSGFLR